MCNLYSITTNQAATAALFRVINRYVGNLPPMPGVFPDDPAPVSGVALLKTATAALPKYHSRKSSLRFCRIDSILGWRGFRRRLWSQISPALKCFGRKNKKMRRFQFALVAAAAVGFASAASAADLPLKAAPAYVAPATWTGFYVGGGVGGRWTDSDWTTTAAFLPFIGIPFPFSTDPNASLDSTALRISGYAGYNWQVAPTWVVGFEGDVGWADNHARLGSRIPGLGVLNFGSFTEVKGTWDASLRAKAGYLITPMVLAYVTGGAAFQHIEARVTCPGDTTVCDPAVGTQSFANSSDRTGWTVGGGLEAMYMRNWLARIEYRYSDFGSFSFTAIPFSTTTFGANASLATKTQIVTLGLGYKF